jgi:hypothetical protein
MIRYVSLAALAAVLLASGVARAAVPQEVSVSTAAPMALPPLKPPAPPPQPISVSTSLPSPPNKVAQPPAPRIFNHGECPLTKDGKGNWIGPDGVVVDPAIAKTGDCKGSK